MPSLPISTSTTGAEIIPAPGANQQIQLLGWDISASDACEVAFKSEDGTLLWETQATQNAGGGVAKNVSSDWGIFAKPGEAVIVTISAAAKVSGQITFATRGNS